MSRVFLLIIVTLVVFYSFQDDMFLSEVKNIEIDGDLQYADMLKIREKASALIGTKSYEIDLRDTKMSFEEISWIKKSQITLKPPDKLHILLIEHEPVYLWNNESYVNKDGEIFLTDTLPVKEILKLSSNDFNHIEMYELYKSVQSILLDEDIVVEEISKKSETMIIITNNIQITLKHSRYSEKITDFISVFPELVKKMPDRKKYRIDLRYPTGFAVQ